MRRITIITSLLAAVLVPAASAHAARPLAKADAERIAVRQVQDTVSAAESYGVYQVANTSHRCQRARSSNSARVSSVAHRWAYATLSVRRAPLPGPIDGPVRRGPA